MTGASVLEARGISLHQRHLLGFSAIVPQNIAVGKVTGPPIEQLATLAQNAQDRYVRGGR